MMKIIASLSLAGVIAISCALSAGCGGAGTESSNSARPSQQPAQTITGQPANITPTVQVSRATSGIVLRVWRDFSKSASESDLKRITPELIEGIRARSVSFDGVEVVRFANAKNSIWSEEVKRFMWGATPVCKDLPPPDLSNAPLEVRMKTGDRQEYINEQTAKHNEACANDIKDHQRLVNDQLELLKAYLLQSPEVGAPCTKFKFVRARLEKENRPANLVLTDGWADCGEEKISENVSPQFQGKVVVLLLTRHSDSQATEGAYASRADYMMRMFPNAEVIPGVMPLTALDDLLK